MLISPGCLILIAVFLWLSQLYWYPSHPNIGISVLVYLMYWILLASLQAALLSKFQHPDLARKWFPATAITGFLLMLAHEVALLGINTGGQGVIFLLISLPLLAILGGPILGLTQFLLLRDIDNFMSRNRHPSRIWFLTSSLSWVLGFLSIFFGGHAPVALIFLALFGTGIKGVFVANYLQI